MTAKQEQGMATWVAAVVVVSVLLGMGIGRTYFGDTEAFKWFWRAVWLIGVPIALIFGYRFGKRGYMESRRAHTNED